MLTDIEKLIMELKEEKEALEKRLNYLLRSKTIQLFDECDPVTGEHLRQISRLDTYGVRRKLLEFEKSHGVGYGLPGHEPPETIQVRQIKTIAHRIDDADSFDEAVNRALKEGWSLTKRTFQRPLFQPSTNTIYTMLYAELDKVVTFPVIEANTKEEPTSQHQHCETCKYEEVPAHLPPCRPCLGDRWEPKEATPWD